MKNFSNFVANKPSSILSKSKVVAFFIATNIGLSLPADCCTLQSVIGLGGSGGGSLSYNILIFHSQMPSLMKDYNGAKYSNSDVTPNGAKSVSVATIQLQCNNPYSIACFEDFLSEASQCFDVEKNAKNQAYEFIFSRGLFREFSLFCMQTDSKNSHVNCVKYIELLTLNEN